MSDDGVLARTLAGGRYGLWNQQRRRTGEVYAQVALPAGGAA